MIEFGANAEAERVLAAVKTLPRLLDGRKKKATEADIDVELVRWAASRRFAPSPAQARCSGRLGSNTR